MTSSSPLESSRTRVLSILLAVAFGAAMGTLPSGRAQAQEAYAGVWRGGTDGYYLWVGVEWDNFVAKWEELGPAGLRLIDLETYMDGDVRKYSGVWRAGTDAHYLWVGVEWNDFVAKWEELSKQNLRLIDIETWMDGRTRRYAGVYRAGSDGHFLWSGVEWNDFVAKWEELAPLGLRLIDIETWEHEGTRRYTGVWRSGNDGHYLWVGVDWADFVAKWEELAPHNLRLIDFETYLVGGERRYAGVWREGSDGYGLWVGVDFENFVSKWHSWAQEGLRLIDIETYPGCNAACANQVVANSPYNYQVTGDGMYRWPVDTDGANRYVRLSAVDYTSTPGLVLPFTDSAVKRRGTWLYSPNSWHHAIDYSRDDLKTFEVTSSAPGRVVHVGWDNWSGNTVIVSHDAGGETDAFRTIHMHLRNGASNDCDLAWSQTVPTLSGNNKTEYLAHLDATGCPSTVDLRSPDPVHWGTEGQTIGVLEGETVAAGEFLAWAGNTGPGGKRGLGNSNTHLHTFFARRDLTDDRWYFIDPYGIYAPPSCYPASFQDPIGGACARYPNAWRDGHTVRLVPEPTSSALALGAMLSLALLRGRDSRTWLTGPERTD